MFASVPAPRTRADVLVELADDPSVTVRAAVALNAAAPAQVNDALARDHDERVRILLARKLAALVPGLSAIDQARLYQETWDTLKALVCRRSGSGARRHCRSGQGDARCAAAN